jgi:hypothetical protein
MSLSLLATTRTPQRGSCGELQVGCPSAFINILLIFSLVPNSIVVIVVALLIAYYITTPNSPLWFWKQIVRWYKDSRTIGRIKRRHATKKEKRDEDKKKRNEDNKERYEKGKKKQDGEQMV